MVFFCFNFHDFRYCQTFTTHIQWVFNYKSCGNHIHPHKKKRIRLKNFNYDGGSHGDGVLWCDDNLYDGLCLSLYEFHCRRKITTRKYRSIKSSIRFGVC